MASHEFANHPGKRDRPNCVATLSVNQVEWAVMQVTSTKYAPVQIIGVERVPIIPAFEIEILCQTAQAARALDVAVDLYRDEPAPSTLDGKRR